MNKNVAVIIPIYKSSLAINEEVSLKQVRKILKKYDIFFILPNTLNINFSYEGIFEKRYSEHYFSSLRAYSKFMLREELYEDFRKYEYILIYQLDAFVFEDRLQEFCALGYDYIGAPWLKGVYFKKNRYESVWYVGNGGFSLRKVGAFIKWTKNKEFAQFVDYINEDILIAAYGSPMLQIAPIQIALSFSFEREYELCMTKTGGKIPFGCHAWEKYNFDSWKKLISKCGYGVTVGNRNIETDINLSEKINELFCRKKVKEFIINFLSDNYKKSKDGIYIWGAGQWGIAVMQEILESGLQVAGFVDNNIKKCGRTILSYEITYSRDILNGQEKKMIIVAIVNKSEQVEKQLQPYGYIKGVDYVLLTDILDNSKLSRISIGNGEI